MSDLTIKRGDVIPLTCALGVDLSGYSSATVILCRPGSTPITITGSITAGTGGTVTCNLTSSHTAVAGTYQVEVEMGPGPHTYPSDGYVILTIEPDLNPS